MRIKALATSMNSKSIEFVIASPSLQYLKSVLRKCYCLGSLKKHKKVKCSTAIKIYSWLFLRLKYWDCIFYGKRSSCTWLADSAHIQSWGTLLYCIKVSGIPSGNKLIKTIRYPHKWRYDILKCEDIVFLKNDLDPLTTLKFVGLWSKHLRSFFSRLRQSTVIFEKCSETFVWHSG